MGHTLLQSKIMAHLLNPNGSSERWNAFCGLKGRSVFDPGLGDDIVIAEVNRYIRESSFCEEGVARFREATGIKEEKKGKYQIILEFDVDGYFNKHDRFEIAEKILKQFKVEENKGNNTTRYKYVVRGFFNAIRFGGAIFNFSSYTVVSNAGETNEERGTVLRNGKVVE